MASGLALNKNNCSISLIELGVGADQDDMAEIYGIKLGVEEVARDPKNTRTHGFLNDIVQHDCMGPGSCFAHVVLLWLLSIQTERVT